MFIGHLVQITLFLWSWHLRAFRDIQDDLVLSREFKDACQDIQAVRNKAHEAEATAKSEQRKQAEFQAICQAAVSACGKLNKVCEGGLNSSKQGARGHCHKSARACHFKLWHSIPKAVSRALCPRSLLLCWWQVLCVVAGCTVVCEGAETHFRTSHCGHELEAPQGGALSQKPFVSTALHENMM